MTQGGRQGSRWGTTSPAFPPLLRQAQPLCPTGKQVMGFLHSLQDQLHLLHFLRFCVWLPQACTNYCHLGSKDFVRKSKFHQMCDSGGEKGNFRKKKSALRPAFLKNVSWHRKALFCNTTCDKSLNSLLAHDPNTHTDTCTQSQEATIHFKRNWP